MSNEEKLYCVYKHTSPSGKVYIGYTSKNPPEKRWSNGNGYKRGHPYFWRAICKYKWENFSHEIMFSGLTRQEVIEKERELILFYDATNPNKGYNMTKGGDGKEGYVMPDETRKKISTSRLGRFTGEENSNYGNHKLAGENNPFYGKHHSDETKKKMSDIATGRPSPMKGKHFSDEARKNIKNAHQKRCKLVIQFDLSNNIIAEYKSLQQASDITGFNKSSISACCRGKTKTSYGFIWRYKEDE